MESIIVTPKNQEEFRLLTDLLAKMDISSKVLSEEEKEDTGLGILLQEADRNEKVSREEIMNKLEEN
ncbi:hypothetical protein [Dyadobacter bucti]|uniref:hypothetical protein n=1 Tax=Dyadobacter bucti TaxID=2572203 RepID=UPI00110894FB|nr:hypothetical protein [Dyadobacter bucti]